MSTSGTPDLAEFGQLLLARPSPRTPFAHRLRVRATVRRCRDAAGLTQDEPEERLDWSTSKVGRIENGHSGISRTDAEAAERECGLDEPEIAAQLVASVHAGRSPGPFDGPYRDAVTEDTRHFYEREHAADKLCCQQFGPVPAPPAAPMSRPGRTTGYRPERHPAVTDLHKTPGRTDQ